MKSTPVRSVPARIAVRVVRHGDDALARIAVQRAERVALLAVDVVDAGIMPGLRS